MNLEQQLLLLKIIKHNGNIQPLIELGFDFSQVVDMIREEKSHGYVAEDKGKISLTEQGLKQIEILEHQEGRKFPWIEPELESRIDPLEKDEVYIPLRESIRHLFGENK